MSERENETKRNFIPYPTDPDLMILDTPELLTAYGYAVNYCQLPECGCVIPARRSSHTGQWSRRANVAKAVGCTPDHSRMVAQRRYYAQIKEAGHDIRRHIFELKVELPMPHLDAWLRKPLVRKPMHSPKGATCCAKY